MSTNPNVPPQSTPERLPSEIWNVIIPHLADDTCTIAACMRVSSTVRDITGPHLYSCVKWHSGSDIEHYPFHDPSPPSDSRRSDHSITPKSSFFKYIHFFQLDEHHLTRCRSYPDPATTLRIPILRIRATTSVTRLAQSLGIKLQFRRIKRVIERFTANKLILDRIQSLSIPPFLPSESFDQRRVETLVMLVDLRLARQCGRWGSRRLARFWDREEGFPFDDRVNRNIAKRAVIIIRSILYCEDAPFGPAPLSEDWLGRFCEQVAISAGHPDFANEIVIVNYPMLTSTESKIQGRPDQVDPRTYIRSRVEDYWERESRILDGYWQLSEVDRVGPRPRRSLEEAQKVNFRFLTLAEYVAEYDWDGQFTQEEVDQILAPIRPGVTSWKSPNSITLNDANDLNETENVDGLTEEVGEESEEEDSPAQDWLSDDDEDLDYSVPALRTARRIR